MHMENKPFDIAFIAKNIFEKRTANNMSQLELAKKLHVSKRSVKAWEKGITLPSLTNVLSLCNFFNVKVDDFIGLSSMANHK